MCKFCETMQTHMNIDQMSFNDEIETEYTVAIVKRTWIPKYQSKRTASRSVGYKRNGVGFDLNFCPECGKSMR